MSGLAIQRPSLTIRSSILPAPEMPQPQRVAQHEHAGQRHGTCPQHRGQQDAEGRIERAGRQRDYSDRKSVV